VEDDGWWRAARSGTDSFRPWNLHSDASARRQPRRAVTGFWSVPIRRRLDLDGDAYECDGATTRPRMQADARRYTWTQLSALTGSSIPGRASSLFPHGGATRYHWTCVRASGWREKKAACRPGRGGGASGNSTRLGTDRRDGVGGRQEGGQRDIIGEAGTVGDWGCSRGTRKKSASCS
jgi:hypothetical protein